jgi:hypothetical protein
MGKHFIDPKRSEVLSVFPSTTQIALFFGQTCSLPFSSRSLDIPAILKSWQKHDTGRLEHTNYPPLFGEGRILIL